MYYVENENKKILIVTLKALLKDLQREKFALFAARKKKAQFQKEEFDALKKIKEIRNRIEYNVNTHKELLKE